MSAELIHQMYIAYYQRPADPAGLIYWQDQLTANGGGETGWNAVAAAFANAAESSSLYGNQTLGQKISAIYLAAFERAASTEEVAFWEASGFNAAQIGFAIVNGAQNDDLSTVTKKVDYAEAFVAAIDPAGTGVGPFEFQYVDASLGRSLMDPITKDSDVSSTTVASQVSSTLPTLNNVNLTSGNDVVTPVANAAEVINAALGGSSPSLSRADQIDGGSATDTLNVDMDGNFLLGFGSGGFMKNVETVNLAATASSVTPKLFNFTGASGIETINVGAANAQISLSEITDTGITVNLSGQTTGTFDIGYGNNVISAVGSSMTIGVTDVGATDAVTVTSNGITDLNLISYGSNNKVNLGNSVNDLVSLVVTGTGALEITDLPDTVSGLDVSGLGGDFTGTLNSNDNAVLVVAGQTISGGTGHDKLILDGSGVAAFTSTGIEELKWDGASGETVVFATAMTGLNTITFSGDAVTTPTVFGIQASALTVNAIYEGSDTYIVTADAALTVNLDVDPSKTARSDNDFSFTSDSANPVTINVGQNTSAVGASTIHKATSIDVSLHASSTFGGQVKGSGATTINVSGAGALANARISGKDTQTLTMDVGSGTFNFGSSAIQTISLTANDGLSFDNSTNNMAVSGVVTFSTNIGGSAEFAAGLFQKLTNATFSGAGASAAVGLGQVDISGHNVNVTISGLDGGFSAHDIGLTSGNIVIDGTLASGKLNLVELSGTESVTVQGGTGGGLSANEIRGSDGVIIDMSARGSGTSADIKISTLTSSGAITVTTGASSVSSSAELVLSSTTTNNNFTLDASNWGGNIHAGVGSELNASGDVTITLGSRAHFSSDNAVAAEDTFVLDASNSVTAEISVNSVSAGNGLTVSLGQGTTASTVSAGDLNGSTVTFDATSYGGDVNITGISASGNVVVALGSSLQFSAGGISSNGGNITIDGSNGTTATMALNHISASGNVTISVGGGTGSVTANGIGAAGSFTLDGSTFGGSVQLGQVSVSGNATISTGGNSFLSALSVLSTNSITIDQSAGTSAGMTIVGIDATKNITISTGGGSGDVSIASANASNAFVLDGSPGTGSIDFGLLSASGNISIVTTSGGDLSASVVQTAGSLTIDGSGSTTADLQLATFSAGGAMTVSLGSGEGTVKLGHHEVNMDVKTFTLDAPNFDGNIDIYGISTSGAVTITSGGAGNFSAGSIGSAGAAILDFSNKESAATVTLTNISANSVLLTIGGTTAALTLGAVHVTSTTTTGNNFTLDGANAAGNIDISAITASGNIAITMGGAGSLSSDSLFALGNITIDNSTSTTGRIVSNNLSASGSITISAGNSTGGSTFTFSAIGTGSNFTMNATGINTDINFNGETSAGGNFTLYNGGTGSLTLASTMIIGGAMDIDVFLGNDGSNEEVLTLEHIGTSTDLSVTILGGTGAIVASSLNAGATFSLDTSLSTEATTGHDIEHISASAVSITMGTGDSLAVSAFLVGAGGATIGNSGSADFTLAGEIMSAAGSVTINQEGAGTYDFQKGISSHGGFTYNGSGLASNAAHHLSVQGLSASAAVAFNFGDGQFANVSAHDVHTQGSFTFAGSSLATADIVFQSISAGGAVSIDVGGASGDLTLSSIVTNSTLTLELGSAPNIDPGQIASIDASSNVTINLGATSDDANFFSVSALETHGTITLNAGGYRSDVAVSEMSADGAINLNFGTLNQSFSATHIDSMGAFTLNAGSGPSFSADIKNGDFATNFTITMANINNGIHIGSGTAMTISASGVVVGTLEVDTMSVLSTSQAGDELTLDFDMGNGDGKADILKYREGDGKDYVIVRNFETGTDAIHSDGASATLTNMTLDVTAAATLIQDALGLSSAPNVADVTHQSGASANLLSAVWTYNGDTFFLGGDTDTASANGDGTFADAEVIFRFVGITDFGNNAGDYTTLA